MRAVLHGLAIVVVVAVASLCVLVQVADVDRALDGIASRGETSAAR